MTFEQLHIESEDVQEGVLESLLGIVEVLQNLQYNSRYEQIIVVYNASNQTEVALVELLGELQDRKCIRNKFTFTTSYPDNNEVEGAHIVQLAHITNSSFAVGVNAQLEHYTVSKSGETKTETKKIDITSIAKVTDSVPILFFGSSSPSCFDPVINYYIATRHAQEAARSEKTLINGGVCASGSVLNTLNHTFVEHGGERIYIVCAKKYWNETEHNHVLEICSKNPTAIVQVYLTETIQERVYTMCRLVEGGNIIIGPGGFGTVEEVILMALYMKKYPSHNITVYIPNDFNQYDVLIRLCSVLGMPVHLPA